MKSSHILIQDYDSGSAMSLGIEGVDNQYLNVSVKNKYGEFRKNVFIHSDLQSLKIYFKDISTHWQGWAGAKIFSSVEGDFIISSVHDARSKIIMNVKISDDSGNDDWGAFIKIYINCGEFEGVSHKINSIDSVCE